MASSSGVNIQKYIWNHHHLGVYFRFHPFLVGGFNPFQKNLSNWIISPGRGKNKKYSKPPPRCFCSQETKFLLWMSCTYGRQTSRVHLKGWNWVEWWRTPQKCSPLYVCISPKESENSFGNGEILLKYGKNHLESQNFHIDPLKIDGCFLLKWSLFKGYVKFWGGYTY